VLAILDHPERELRVNNQTPLLTIFTRARERRTVPRGRSGGLHGPAFSEQHKQRSGQLTMGRASERVRATGTIPLALSFFLGSLQET
jgi:hypothetical protein